MKATDQCVDFSRWQRAYWITDRRYYVAEVKQDLFGAWVLERTWGSRFSQRGNCSTILAENYEDALARLAEVEKRRKARGYRSR